MKKEWSGSLAMKAATEGKPLIKFLGARPNSRSGSGFAPCSWDFQSLRRILGIWVVVCSLRKWRYAQVVVARDKAEWLGINTRRGALNAMPRFVVL
jgi:hypothetical protein